LDPLCLLLSSGDCVTTVLALLSLQETV